VLIEALACGTPVVAYRCGAVPEILQDGVTGFVVNDQPQAIDAARRIDAIDRRAWRQAFESRFTSRRMAQRDLAVYEALSAALPRLSDTDTTSQLPI
jgi:glycosyltransferase involved in cell wall biosynthesis